jgi:hypothetical protein
MNGDFSIDARLLQVLGCGPASECTVHHGKPVVPMGY